MKPLSDLSNLLSSIHVILCMYCLGTILCPTSQNFHFQRNALRIICFAKLNDHTAHQFRKMKIIKFVDLVSVGNCIFIKNAFLANLTLLLAICIIQPLVDIITKQDQLWMASYYYLIPIPLNLVQKPSYIPEPLLRILSRLCFQKRISEYCLQ